MSTIPYNYGKYIDDKVSMSNSGTVDAGKQVNSPASAGSRGLAKTTQFTKDPTQMKMGNSPIAESMVEIRNILNRIDGVNVPVKEDNMQDLAIHDIEAQLGKINDEITFLQIDQKDKESALAALGELRSVLDKYQSQQESAVKEDAHDDWSKVTNALIKKYGEDKAKAITDYAQIGTDSAEELMKSHGLTHKGDGKDEERWFQKYPWLKQLANKSWMGRLKDIAGEGPDYGTPVKMESAVNELADDDKIEFTKVMLAISQIKDRVEALSVDDEAKKSAIQSLTNAEEALVALDESVSEDAGSLTDQQKQGLQAVHNKFKGHVTSAGGSLPYEYLNYEIEPELYSDMIDSKEEDKAAKAFGYDSLEDVQRAMDNGEIEGDYPEDIEKYIPITMTAWAAVDSVLKDANDEQRKAARDYLLSISESVAEDPELSRIKKLAFYQ